MSLGQGKSYIRVVIYKNWVILLLDRHPCLYEKKMKTKREHGNTNLIAGWLVYQKN